MDTLEFLKRVLPSHGLYCMMTVNNGKMNNQPFQTIDALASACAAATRMGKDVWMGLGSYKEEKSYNPKYDAYHFRRMQSNVSDLASLWLDVDIDPKDEMKYSTAVEAAQALSSFLTTTGLPVPLVVKSGGGMHLYWPLGQDVPQERWYASAQRLKALCMVHKFKTDPVCTSDAARVLRPVGSMNFKTGTGREVKLLSAEPGQYTFEQLEALLEQLAEPHQEYIEQYRSGAVAQTDAMHPLLRAMNTWNFGDDTRKSLPIVKGCQQIREAGMQSEPVWHRMICLMKMTDEPKRFIHALSKLDEDRYDESATEDKIYTSVEAAVTCSEFNKLRPGICSGCPHNGKITSPIQLGSERKIESEIIVPPAAQAVAMPSVVEVPAPVSTEVPAVPCEPVRIEQTFNFVHAPAPIMQSTQVSPTEWGPFRLTDHGMVKMVEKEGGDTFPVTVCRQKIRVFSISIDSDGKVKYTFEIISRNGDVTTVPVPGSELGTPDSVQKFLRDHGVMFPTKRKTDVCDMVNEMVIAADTAGALMMLKSLEHMGWVNVSGKTGFALGQRVYYADGVVAQHDSPALGEYTKATVPVGDLNAWVQGVHTYFANGAHIPQAMVFLQAFAAPLIHMFDGVPSVLWVVTGDTGTGKTTVARMMNSVWQKPDTYTTGAGDKLSNTGSTMNALFNNMGKVHSLPVYMDEITNWGHKDISSTVFDICSGMEKQRMSVGGKTWDKGAWRTCIVGTSNKSVRAAFSDASHKARAQLSRMLEFQMEHPMVDPIYDDAITKITSNYGLAGEVYARALVTNKQTGSLEAAKNSARKFLDERFSFTEEERFWRAAMVSVFVGMELSRSLGLHNIDRDAVVDFMGKILREQRGQVTESRVSIMYLLGQYLSDTMANTRVVSGTNGDLKLSVEAKQSIYNVINKSTGFVALGMTAVRRWCQQSNLSVREFTDAVLADKSNRGVNISATHDFNHGITGVKLVNKCITMYMSTENLHLPEPEEAAQEVVPHSLAEAQDAEADRYF